MKPDVIIIGHRSDNWMLCRLAVAIEAERTSLAGIDWERAQLANVSPTGEPMIGFVNVIRIESDGWAQLAPLGDVVNTAVEVKPDGSIKRYDAVQRMDSQAVTELVNSFKSSKTKRYLTGIPIYDGHPDMPGIGSRYPDKTPKGIIADLQAREDGLWGKPIFTNEGLDLVESKKRKAFSARWTSTDAGKAQDGTPILRPSVLISAGLTNTPNLPVRHLMNAEWQEDQAQPGHTNNNKMKKHIIDLLVALGVQMANDATEEQIETGAKSALEKVKTTATLANEKDTVVTELSNEKAAHTATKSTLSTRTTELSTARTEFANERAGRIEAILDLAIKDGRITAAQRDEWKGKLAAEFANESEAIKKLSPTVKTESVTEKEGKRKAELANSISRREQVSELVTTEMANSKCDYDTAYRRVEKKNPALFVAMKQPEIKTSSY